MGQVLHGSATTTEAVRRAIQNSQESLRALSKRYGINPKTVRSGASDLPSKTRRWGRRTGVRRCCQPITTPGNTRSAAAEIKTAMAAGEVFRAQAFEYACAKADIDHRLTKPNHP